MSVFLSVGGTSSSQFFRHPLHLALVVSPNRWYSKGELKEGKRLPPEQTDEQLKRQTHNAFVKSIAERLDEKEPAVRFRIGLIVLTIGEELTLN